MRKAWTQEIITLNQLLQFLNGIHQIHGYTILFNDTKTIGRIIFEYILTIIVIVNLSALFLAPIDQISDLDEKQKTMTFILGVTGTYIIAMELMYWVQRKNVLELVQWCHWVEEHKPNLETGLKKPRDWFAERRQKIYTIIWILKHATILTLMFMTCFWVPYFNLTIPEGYYLMIELNFKFLSKNSFTVFLFFHFIQCCTSTFILFIFFFSLSFFILFTNYIFGQLELIKIYINQLNLNDTKAFIYGLGEVTGLHLDVIR